jgi:putative MATE family efflux protein
MRKINDMTTGSIPKILTRMTLPMMIGMISLVIFNLIDTLFVSRLGILPLAAMAFTFPVVMVQSAFSAGLGVGASAIISKAIGQKDFEKAKRFTTDSLILSFLIAVLLMIIGLSTIDPLFSLLGVKGQALVLVKNYMRIWYFGLPFIVIPMVGNNAIRAAGNTFIPSAVMVIAVIVNITLDPILIFGLGPFPRMELAGAAIATVIARSVTFVVSLYFLHFRFGMLTTKLSGFRSMLYSWKKMIFIGFPAALNQLLVPLAVGFVTKLVASYGEFAVAALGIGSRIEFFALAPLMSLSAVMTPFTGQNYGAKKFHRILESFRFSTIFSFAYASFIFVILFIFKSNIIRFFTDVVAVQEIAGSYISIVSLSYAFMGTAMVSISILNALHKPFQAISFNIIRLFVFIVPLAWLGSHLFQIPGIFWGISSSMIITAIIIYFWIRRILQKAIVHTL